MAEVLSGKRQQILTFIADSQRDRGYPPSVREIGEAVGLASSATVHTHLAVLQREGYLSRDPSKPRAIQVHYDPTSTKSMATSAVRNVPLIGDVAAGTGVLAQENIEELLPMPEQFTGTGPTFMLRVRGDSMIDAGIFSGDFVVVRQQPEAENGDIVVAGIPDDEATVKTFSRRDGHIVLTPANPAYEPMVFDGEDDVTIFGKVVTIVRQVSSVVRSRCPLFEQAGHPPVGQYLAVRLARGAIRHLIGLERHPAHRVATSGRRAGLAEPSVHSEATTQLCLRKAARPGALEGECLIEHRRGRGQQAFPFFGIERAQRCEGREPGRGAGCHRPNPARFRPPPSDHAGRCADGALLVLVRISSANAGRVGLGSQPLQRPLVAGSQHPPRCLALGSELTDKDRSSLSRRAETPENVKRTTDPRGRVAFGGDSTSTRPACERCTTIRVPLAKLHTRYFALRVMASSV